MALAKSNQGGYINNIMQKQVFISYSHDSDAHMKWVRKFADDLQEKGNMIVLLDQDLPKGASWTRFMQQGLMMSDRVLVIGTPNYLARSLNTGGVAFEESIISSDYMIDIDTTKYYPILREGTFPTAFPPILASRNGDDFTDDSKYEFNLNTVISEINGTDESRIPFATRLPITLPEEEAKVTLSLNILLETMYGNITGKVEGVGLSVSIVNLCKEPRFFVEPHFELSSDVFDGARAFSPTSHWPDRLLFPVRLEYGEMVIRTYILPVASLPMFRNALAQDHNVTFAAYAQNTLGKIFKSEDIPVATIVKDLSK